MKTRSDTGEVNWSYSTKFIVPAILSAVFAALFNANDNGIMHQVLVIKDSLPNPLIPSLSYLFLGSWIGLLTMFAFTFIFGKKFIDENFKGIKWGSWRLQKYAITVGIISSICTFLFLWGSSLFDPSLTLPFASLIILYLVFYDVLRKRVSLQRIGLYVILVILGAFLGSILDLKNFSISIFCLVFLLVIRNGLQAGAEILEQEGVNHTDAANFNFWRFLWLAVGSTIFVGFFAVQQGLEEAVFNFIVSKFWLALPWILLTMGLVYFSNGLKLFAKKHGPVSEILMLGNLQIALGIPITLLVNFLKPGWFGDISQDITVWIVRGVGACLILWGCILLTKIRFSAEKARN